MCNYTFQSLKTQGQVPKTIHLAGDGLLGSSECVIKAALETCGIAQILVGSIGCLKSFCVELKYQ